MVLFDPETNGWKLQRPVTVLPQEIAAEDEGEIGNQKVVALAELEPRVWDLRYRGVGNAAADYMGWFRRFHKGVVDTFSFDVPLFLPRPFDTPGAESIAGGTQGSRTIRLGYTLENTNGETPISAHVVIAVGANQLGKFTFPTWPNGVTGLKIYAEQDGSGLLQHQATLVDFDRDWTQPDAALLLATSLPPTTNTARERVTARMVSGSYALSRHNGQTYEAQMRIQEVF